MRALVLKAFLVPVLVDKLVLLLLLLLVMQV